MAIQTLWDIPPLVGVSSWRINALPRVPGQRYYDAFGTKRFNNTRICPVKFTWLNSFDFNYESVAMMNLDKAVARYQLGYFDQWEDPQYGRYMYLITSLVMLATDAVDMTMTEWDVFYEYVMPSVQGCPVAMVKQAIISATIEFCEKSLIWIQDSIQNDVVAGKAYYTYAPPPFAKVVMPYRVSINNRELEPWDIDKLEDFSKNWKTLEESTPKRYVQVMDDTIRLVGVPTEDIKVTDVPEIDANGRPIEAPSGLMADVVLKPTRNATRCPTFFYTDWAETIAAGSLARLHAQIGKVWAKPELVARYEKVFKEGISRAKSKHDKSYQRESNQMRPIKFYGGRRYYN